MEFYESTYFLVLVPSVVITVIFLFFWLFMKETSYDEILAKQKKDLKLPPAKVDKKRTDKKKNKRKEVHNGNVHESDSESPALDFDLTDALVLDEEPSVPVTLSVAESPSNVRERKKKEKKSSKHLQEETVAKDSGVSKSVGKKMDPIPVTKQPTPPTEAIGGKKKHGQKKPAQSRDDSPTTQEPKVETFVPVTKKHEAHILPVEVKQQETGTGKKRNAIKKHKIENVSALVDEPLIQPTVYIPLMDKTEVIPIMEKDFADLARHDPSDSIHKSNLKKLKNEKNESDIVNGKHGGNKKKYENAEVKFKDFLLGMKNMVFTEEEALSVVDLLKDKATVVHETLQKASKGDSAAHLLQEKEKLLVVAKEEVSVAKEQVKQLSQELKEEKQKSSMIEHKVRERFTSLEKEHGALQNKMHVSYQDNQQLQLKYQQVRDQLEDQIKHLKQENGILRDAVSSATNQMESKQTSELNKLRQDYARLMNDLTEKNNKLAQEEALKKSTEQTIAQLKAQQQDAKHRWEEMETYLRKRTAEFEAAQQDIQKTLVAKDNEIKSLHSKFTDTMVSKQQLEQKLMQLMEAEKNRVTENAIQIQVQELMEQNDALQTQIQKFHAQMTAQTSASVLVEELQKAIVEKDKQIKQQEDSMAFEHVHLTKREEELKALQRENASLKSEFQQVQILKNEQAVAAHAFEQMQRSIHEKDEQVRAVEERLQSELVHFSNAMEDYKANKDIMEQMERSIQEKDEKLKTVEELLEAGLIQVANKEDELKVMRKEHSIMQREVQSLQAQHTDQVSMNSLIDELKEAIHEKEAQIKSIEELLQAEVLKTANKEETYQALREEIEALKKRNSQLETTEQVSANSQVEELQNQHRMYEEKMQRLESTLCEKEKDFLSQENQMQTLQLENETLKIHISEVQQQNQQQLHQVSHNVQSEELLNVIAKKEEELLSLRKEMDLLKDLVEQQRNKNNDLRQKNWQAMEALASTEKRLQEKVNKTDKAKDQTVHAMETETRQMLQNLFPQVSVSSSLRHADWLKEFGKLAKESESSSSEGVQVMEQRLKDAEEVHVLLQLECEKYKAVLAETEGILQRLQCSVEEEEGKWKIKLEETQKELIDVHSLVNSFEKEAEHLRTENKNIENLRKEREHLESELEKAESERVTYVGEVRELKTQLHETMLKLQGEQSERLKVAGNLFQAQQSLDLIQSEILKAAGDPNIIENSGVSPEAETHEKETIPPSLNQTVTQLQQLFKALNQQLTKGNEHYHILE